MSGPLLTLPASSSVEGRADSKIHPRWGFVAGALCVALLALSPLLPSLREHTASRCTLWSVAALGGMWLSLLWRRRSALSVVPYLKPSHYLQMLAQGVVYCLWAAHWSPVVDHLPLLAVQVIFAYLLEILVGWSRYGSWRMSLGVFPILGSVNFFLWFTPEWFALQIALIALIWIFREGVKWQRGHDEESTRVHVFNPSAVGLTIMCLVLVGLGHEGYAVGEAIAASQDETPYIYLAIFGAGLIVQTVFPVVLMTFAAALGALAAGAVYTAIYEVPLFVTTDIPGAVFLGMLLLITDPVTAPRTALGKVVYGGLYGASTAGLFVVLTLWGQPTYYDKILAVPLLNLSVRWIERLTASPRWSPLKALQPAQRNVIHVALWCGVFILMRPGLASHEGASTEYWVEACDRGRHRACASMTQVHEGRCVQGDVTACHNLAVMYDTGQRVARDQAVAARLYQRACDAGDAVGCGNLATMAWQGEGIPLDRPLAIKLWQLACGTEGGAESCENLEQVGPSMQVSIDHDVTCGGGSALGCFRQGLRVEQSGDRAAVARYMGKACVLGMGAGCANHGLMLSKGDGVPRDLTQAASQYQKGCELGLEQACEAGRRLTDLQKLEELRQKATEVQQPSAPTHYPGGADPRQFTQPGTSTNVATP
ncbi:MAG: RnfABCDGE type electron transport complex subunit D [Bradymonadia bacterium]